MATFRVPCQKHVIFPNLKFEIKFLADCLVIWQWIERGAQENNQTT